MKKLLIVVDYQVDFVTGSLGFTGAEKLEDRIAAKIEQYRAESDDILFTLDTHETNYLETQEGKNLPVPHCIKNTPGHALFGKIAQMVHPEDKIIEKPTFPSIELANYLKEKENTYNRIELCGLVSNICVIANAAIVKSALPEVPILVDAQCTASHDQKLHEESLDIMESLQVKVINR